MRKVYNFAYIEYGQMYRGPGKVIGVVAVSADKPTFHCRFRTDQRFATPVARIKTELVSMLKGAKDAGMNGKDLMRCLLQPRQSSTQYHLQGTRFCEAGAEDEMMDLLCDRYMEGKEIEPLFRLA